MWIKSSSSVSKTCEKNRVSVRETWKRIQPLDNNEDGGLAKGQHLFIWSVHTASLQKSQERRLVLTCSILGALGTNTDKKGGKRRREWRHPLVLTMKEKKSAMDDRKCHTSWSS